MGGGRHPGGTTHLPNTFASVDHPFHVARAEVLWRELASGNLLRWIAQHQGGYPVEILPTWRGLARGRGSGLVFGNAACRGCSHPHDRRALPRTERGVCRIGSPGRLVSRGWSYRLRAAYLTPRWLVRRRIHGARAMGPGDQCRRRNGRILHAARDRLVSPHRSRVGRGCRCRAGALAIYCNPRSLLALAALGLGAWLAGIFRPSGARYLDRQRMLEILRAATAWRGRRWCRTYSRAPPIPHGSKRLLQLAFSLCGSRWWRS